ncbi:hypothetical protein ACGFSB_30680 [Streptomyces sp. NPDC048441]|uniref:hypothetical protein n=1 Tax=Streptomyces sp. NPDC048441 TaxID=3365552 RepID=UPI00371FF040
MDLEALRSANFSLLDDAITDWTTMVDNLDRMEESAHKGLTTAANKASWAGVNATVSKEFIGKTADEFSDAHLQARSIRDILRDTRDELKDYQSKLKTAIKNGQDKNLKVTSSGSGFTVRKDSHTDGVAKGAAASETSGADVTALRDEIQELLNKATESDSTASTVLRAIADQSTVGFSGVDYSDRDEAADAIKNADELSKLAKKDPEDLSTAEFDRLNSGLKRFADDELFSQRFATNLGAKGTLEFWVGINTPDANPELNQARHEKFDDLQKNLSLTLSTATQSDALGMTEWTNRVVDLGNQPVRGSGGPLGFQVMSNLMRWGNYDDQFLHSYGTQLMETEKKFTGNGEGRAWQRTSSDPYLNRTGSDSGWDPVTGFMKGLSNSPDAATNFFNDRFISKNDEDNPFNGQNKSNFQYLFEERDWPSESDSEGEPSDTGRNNLALALEAATTGHPGGEMPTKETPAHNAQQTKLTEDLIKSISKNPEYLTEHSYMSDSMGQIAAEYMPDIHRGMHPGRVNEDQLFPIAGSAANLGEHDATRFLYTVGRNPEGYAAVNLGQHSYTTSLMEYHFRNPEAYINDSSFSQNDNLKKGIEDIARVAGEVEGTIGAGRTYEGEQEGGAKDDAYNTALKHASTWGGTAVGIGIGLGTAPMLGPGGIVVGGVGGTAANEIIEAITEGSMKDDAGNVIYRNGQEMEGTKESTYQLVEKAAQKAGDSAGTHSTHIISAAATAAESGFNNAKTNVADAFDGQGVPRQLERPS